MKIQVMLLATYSHIPVLCTQEYHLLAFLSHIRYTNLDKLTSLFLGASSWGGSSDRFFCIFPTMTSFLIQSSGPSLCEVIHVLNVMLCLKVLSRTTHNP